MFDWSAGNCASTITEYGAVSYIVVVMSCNLRDDVGNHCDDGMLRTNEQARGLDPSCARRGGLNQFLACVLVAPV